MRCTKPSSGKWMGLQCLPAQVSWLKQKRKAGRGFNPKTEEKIRMPAKTVVRFRVAKVAKDAVLGVKK